ncbi:unnamed protein product [Durusdinium trenchii]|uniref:Uncharacterized protein n=1 Tax=Durusdinium trenchii TaxID=1381693 RepID=A0ABP0HD46_9DINO
MVNQSTTARSYLNLQLSYRGSERQPPSALSVALFFSGIMQAKSEDGTHDKSMSTESRLKAVIAEYHDQPGVLARYRIDPDKERAILNLVVGTSAGTRTLIQAHLNHHRWRESCFTADLLKSSRWLIGASPRNCKEYMKSMLTVTQRIQEKFMQNVIAWFSGQVQKIRASTRAKFRPSQTEWDRMVDYTCVMERVKVEAQATLTHDPEKCKSVLKSIKTCFANRDYYEEVQTCVEVALVNWNVKHLSIWSELVQPAALALDEAHTDVVEMEECTLDAQFQEVRSKISLVEDKMGQLGLALRDLRIPIDCSELHGNSERPLFFHGWLAIPDSTLPAKGVGYRRNTNEESRDLSAVAVNIFSQSDLWKLQGLPLENVPRAVCEGDFCVPSPKSFLISADSRRNLTDTQETAQWIAGEDVFSKLIKSAFGRHLQKGAVVHSTCYCGSVEKACMALGGAYHICL